MKRILILLAVVGVAAVLVAWAQVPLRDVDTRSVPTAESTPLHVTVGNFPLDAEGSILTAPVANRLLDLLDTDISIPNGDSWDSEVFDTAAFTSITLQMTAVGPPGQCCSNHTACRVEWQLSNDDPFIWGSGGNTVPAMTQMTIATGSAQETTMRTGGAVVQGPLARVHCWVQNASGSGLIGDVKVLLRRE